MTNTLEDRVRTVIEQVSGTQASFAALVGLTTDKLSKSLSGRRRFTSLELGLIASAGNVTVDWLVTGKAPARPLIAARRDSAVAGYTEVPDLVDRCADAYEVIDLLGRASPPSASGASGGRRPDGESLAADAVASLALAGHAPIAHLGIAELIAAAEATFSLDVTVDRLPAGLDGLAWQTASHRLCVLAATRQWTRQRFTFAHELGHLLAGHAQHVVVDRHLSPGQDTDPTERLANRFAAAFLMPAAELQQRQPDQWDSDAFAQLVVEFKVSPSAMAVRLRSLRLIDGAQYQRFRTFTSLACHEAAGTIDGYLSQVNEATAVRLPRRLVSALFQAYRDGDTTLRPLAGLLGVDVDELRDVLDGTSDAAPSNGRRGDPVFAL